MGEGPQNQPQQQAHEPDDRPNCRRHPPGGPTELAFVGLGQEMTEERLGHGEDEEKVKLEAGEFYHACRLRPRGVPSHTTPEITSST